MAQSLPDPRGGLGPGWSPVPPASAATVPVRSELWSSTTITGQGRSDAMAAPTTASSFRAGTMTQTDLVDGNGGALAGTRICQKPPRPVKRYSHAANEH